MQASTRSVIQVAALLAAVLSITGAAGASEYEIKQTNFLGHTIQDAIGCFDSHTSQDCLSFRDPPVSEDDDENLVLFSSIYGGASVSFFDEHAGLGSIAGDAVLLDHVAESERHPEDHAGASTDAAAD